MWRTRVGACAHPPRARETHKHGFACKPIARWMSVLTDRPAGRNAPTEEEGYPEVMGRVNNFVMERGFDLIERLVYPPIDQFLK